MRVLAVDPGLTRCGIAVVDALPSRRVAVGRVEVVMTDPGASLGERLLDLEERVGTILRRECPDVVAMEQVFSQHNVRTVLGTAQAAGVVALAATRAGVPVVFHSPSEVKAAVTGSGRADKRQVARMVGRIAGGPIEGPPDATDAVALGICHIWRRPIEHAAAVTL